MKRTLGKKSGTQQGRDEHTQKPPCGTLTYMAECRGMARKSEPLRRFSPPENVGTSRKYSAET